MYQMSRSGPGPAKYVLPPTIGFTQHDVRKDRMPMFSMRSKFTTRYDTIGPGPAYHPGKMTREGSPSNPMYSFGRRFNQLTPDNIPGPGLYHVPSMMGNCSPAFSFGTRRNKPNRDSIPGPDHYVYNLNAYKHRSPVYSIRTRTNLARASEGPGPNHYGLLDRNITHKRSPMYSMGIAYSTKEDRNLSPGPNRYGLMNLKQGASSPRYTFGVRHSMWKPPMIIQGDNC